LMFKKLFHISTLLCLMFSASRSHAQQGAQPLFTIVNGSDGAKSGNNGNPSVTLPVLGFVLDQSGGLRPLIGIAGAASVGAPLGLSFPIAQAAMPPNHDYILAMTVNTGWPVLLQVRGNTITVRPVASVLGNAGAKAGKCYQPNSFDDRARSGCDANADAATAPSGIDSVAVSPTGSAAGLFSQSQGRIYAFGNLSQTPVLLATFDTGGLGNVSTFGISDDGSTVIVGGSSPNSGSLYLISSGQGPRLIGSIQHPAAVQFLRNNVNAIVADDVDNEIYQVTNGQLYAVASANDGIATPVGIGISNDNQKVFVGNSASGAVTTLSLSGAAAQSMPCNCALTGIQPTSADSVFELTGFSGGPISLFDGGSATSRMIFVPVSAQF
jgi:hypothetical protein